MEDLKQQLVQRLNDNLSDYHQHLLGFQKEQIIDMADRIALTADVHTYLTSRYEFGAGETERLLQFENPLEVVTDAWAIQRMDIADLDYIIARTCERPEALREYRLAEQEGAAVISGAPPPPTPEEANPVDTLFARLEENLRAYEAEMLSLTPREIYDRTDEATAVKDAHYYLTCAFGVEPDEAEYLLRFQNPLEVVADAWREHRDGMATMPAVLDEVIDSEDVLGRYALAEQRESITPEQSAEKPSILAQLHKSAEQARQQPPAPGSKNKDIQPR